MFINRETIPLWRVSWVLPHFLICGCCHGIKAWRLNVFWFFLSRISSLLCSSQRSSFSFLTEYWSFFYWSIMAFTNSSSTDQPSSSNSNIRFSLFSIQSLIFNLSFVITIKFNGENFLLWKSQFQAILRAYQLQYMINASFDSPSPTVQDSQGSNSTNPNFLEWQTTDQQLFICLFVAVTERVLPHISHSTSFKEAWFLLECKYSSLSRSNVLQIKNHIQNVKKDNQAMSDFLQKIKELTDTLVAVGLPMEEEDKILHILNGLPPDFYAFTTAVHFRPQQISLMELQDMLLIEEKQLALRSVDLSSTSLSLSHTHTYDCRVQIKDSLRINICNC